MQKYLQPIATVLALFVLFQMSLISLAYTFSYETDWITNNKVSEYYNLDAIKRILWTKSIKPNDQTPLPIYSYVNVITDYDLTSNGLNISKNRTNAYSTTVGLNAIIDEKKAQKKHGIKLPLGDYLIDASIGLNIPSYFVLDLNGSTLWVEGNNKVEYNVIKIIGQNNVQITNGTIIGDRTSLNYTSSIRTLQHDFSPPGEHDKGIGILIQDSNRLLIQNVRFEYLTGDGIRIIGHNNDVTVKTSIFGHNRHRGININGSCTDSEIYNCKIYQSGGSWNDYAPSQVDNELNRKHGAANWASGISIEPRDYSVSGLRIHHNEISDCKDANSEYAAGIELHSGKDYSVYGNSISGNLVYAFKPENISIYNNSFANNSWIEITNSVKNIRLWGNLPANLRIKTPQFGTNVQSFSLDTFQEK